MSKKQDVQNFMVDHMIELMKIYELKTLKSNMFVINMGEEKSFLLLSENKININSYSNEEIVIETQIYGNIAYALIKKDVPQSLTNTFPFNVNAFNMVKPEEVCLLDLNDISDYLNAKDFWTLN